MKKIKNMTDKEIKKMCTPVSDFVERKGRMVCKRCGYELSAMLGDNEIPTYCEGCGGEPNDDTIEALGYEGYAALWGCDPCYDRAPREPGDGYLFYNFGCEGGQEFLYSFLGAIARTILEVKARKTGVQWLYSKAEKHKDLENLKELSAEVKRRIGSYSEYVSAKMNGDLD